MTLSRISLTLIGLLIYSATISHAQPEIQWKEEIVLEGTFKYIRLCKVTKGPAAGDIIMTYFQSNHSAPFGMRRSQDAGRSWSDEIIFMRNDDTYFYVNPGILQLDDGRLMLSYCKRTRNPDRVIPEQGPCVRFSEDGGYTWGPETFIAWGGDYEPAAIQVPNDKNGNGHNDIYLFWSMSVNDQSYDLNVTPAVDVNRGFATGVVASYDNGETWENFMPTKLGARIIHRNFHYKHGSEYYKSKGNMPTPVLLPNHRIGVVTEAVDKATSPWFTISDPHDWDWEKFQGEEWTDYTYFGYPPYREIPDNNVYPTDRDYCWRPTFQDDTFGGAPYANVLPNGHIVFTQNSAQRIRVWVADPYGKNPVRQIDPFMDKPNSFYSCIIPINDTEVLLAAHNNIDRSQAFIRIGKIIKDTIPPTTPENLSWTQEGDKYELSWSASTDNIIVHKYEIFANGTHIKTVLWDNFATIEGLDQSTEYVFTVRAQDYQGNYSDSAVGIRNTFTENKISLFPNPADKFLNIQTNWPAYHSEIINLNGQRVLSFEHTISSIDISSLQKGIYIIRISNNENTYIDRFIKL